MVRRAKTVVPVRGKGQITIPAEIRRAANLVEGALVEFEVIEEGVLLRRRAIADPDTAIDDDYARAVIEQTTAGYAALRKNESAWHEELAERELLTGSLGDGLDD